MERVLCQSTNKEGDPCTMLAINETKFCFFHQGEPEPKSWAPQVIADNSGNWCGNGLFFKTKQSAEEWVAGLAQRWTLVRDTRVVPSQKDPNR